MNIIDDVIHSAVNVSERRKPTKDLEKRKTTEEIRGSFFKRIRKEQQTCTCDPCVSLKLREENLEAEVNDNSTVTADDVEMTVDDDGNIGSIQKPKKQADLFNTSFTDSDLECLDCDFDN